MTGRVERDAGDLRDRAWMIGTPIGIMVVFWLLAGALWAFPEFGTRMGRTHYADAVRTLSGGAENAMVKGLRAGSGDASGVLRGMDRKGIER